MYFDLIKFLSNPDTVPVNVHTVVYANISECFLHFTCLHSSIALVIVYIHEKISTREGAPFSPMGCRSVKTKKENIPRNTMLANCIKKKYLSS